MAYRIGANLLADSKALTQEMGPSMFASEGDEWQRKHRALQPLVSHGALKHNTVVCNRLDPRSMPVESIAFFD